MPSLRSTAATEISVVIPTRNEAANIAHLLALLDDNLRNLRAEILFVDDSDDETPTAIRASATALRIPVRLIQRQHALGGLSGAVMTGIAAAASPWVVVMDADLQHPPSTIPSLYRCAIEGEYDVVVASRFASGAGGSGGLGSRFRRVASASSATIARLLFPSRLAGCSDPMSGFFAVRRDAVDGTRVRQIGYKVLLSTLVHRDLRVTEIPFTFERRLAGESKAGVREGIRYLRLLLVLRISPEVRWRNLSPPGNRAVGVVEYALQGTSTARVAWSDEVLG